MKTRISKGSEEYEENKKIFIEMININNDC